MQFNALSDSSGLCQDADFWVDTDTTKYPLKHKARNANEWVRKVATWIWQADSDWKFDDSNLTTLPTATTTMTDAIQDISLPTNVFKIDRLEVKDIAGNWNIVSPINQFNINEEALQEFCKTPGLPQYYDVDGNSLILYPAPDATMTTLIDGLTLYLSREMDSFVATDTTKEPGFSDYFHRIVSIGMAYDYAVKKGLSDKVSLLKKQIYGDPAVADDKGLKGELIQAYGSRHPDYKRKFRIKVDDRI